MINRPKGEEKIRREMRYPENHLQVPFPCLRYSHESPSSVEKKFPLTKNGKKAVAVISQSSFFPRKKARTFVLTFKKARGIKETFFSQNVFLASGFAASP
jgi:hypothetical protein